MTARIGYLTALAGTALASTALAGTALAGDGGRARLRPPRRVFAAADFPDADFPDSELSANEPAAQGERAAVPRSAPAVDAGRQAARPGRRTPDGRQRGPAESGPADGGDPHPGQSTATVAPGQVLRPDPAALPGPEAPPARTVAIALPGPAARPPDRSRSGQPHRIGVHTAALTAADEPRDPGTRLAPTSGSRTPGPVQHPAGDPDAGTAGRAVPGAHVRAASAVTGTVQDAPHAYPAVAGTGPAGRTSAGRGPAPRTGQFPVPPLRPAGDGTGTHSAFASGFPRPLSPAAAASVTVPDTAAASTAGTQHVRPPERETASAGGPVGTSRAAASVPLSPAPLSTAPYPAAVTGESPHSLAAPLARSADPAPSARAVPSLSLSSFPVSADPAALAPPVAPPPVSASDTGGPPYSPTAAQGPGAPPAALSPRSPAAVRSRGRLTPAAGPVAGGAGDRGKAAARPPSPALSIGTIEVKLLAPPQDPPSAPAAPHEPRQAPQRLSRGLGRRFGQGQS